MGLEDLNKLAGQADRYNDSFVNAVCNAGLLLHNKKMDASACTTWGEANIGLCSQHIIL
jgi:hypothetical protein